MGVVMEAVAPPSFEWRRWPETEAFVDRLIATALEGNAFARGLAERMPGETGTRFSVWVDHLVLAGGPGLGVRLEALGYRRQPIMYAVNAPVFAHDGGMFPRIAVLPAGPGSNGRSGDGPAVREVAIKVDSVAAFSRATTWGWMSRATRWGRTASARLPARGRRWRWSSGGRTWASSRSRARWRARAG